MLDLQAWRALWLRKAPLAPQGLVEVVLHFPFLGGPGSFVDTKKSPSTHTARVLVLSLRVSRRRLRLFTGVCAVMRCLRAVKNQKAPPYHPKESLRVLKSDSPKTLKLKA